MGSARVVRFICSLTASNEQHTEHGADNSGGADRAETLSGEERERHAERGIACGQRSDDSHFADFKGAIERKGAAGVDAAGENAPTPGRPAGAVAEMTQAAENGQCEREQ